MSPSDSAQRPSGLRPQAVRLFELVSRGGSHLHAVILGGAGEGKSHLLGQLRDLLFARGEGPVPILYAVEPGRSEAYVARHFAACLCQQARAFLMRQEELLQEPLVNLEQELERPGLPLSLAELGRELLHLDPAGQPEFAAALPQQFVHREARPLCLLLDDCEALNADPPFLHGLGRLSSPWLLAGRRAFLASLAGVYGWPVAPLEPLSAGDALVVAEQRCRDVNLHFSRQAWEDWLEYAGNSPAWIGALAEGAALAGDNLESSVAMGRVYGRELAEGGLGNWLAGRWERAVPQSRTRPKLAETLDAMAEALATVSSMSPMTGIAGEQVPGLIAEEWLEQSAAGVLPRLGRVERDWLHFVASSHSAPLVHLARARVEQAFLWRIGEAYAEQAEGFRKSAEQLSRRVLPGSPVSLTAAGEKPGERISFPAICSVAVEHTACAELFWCYGFRDQSNAQQREACVLLMALCRKEPSPSELKQWEQAVQNRAAELPDGGAQPRGHYSRGELWLALPPQASRAPVGEERRLTWENLSQLLGRKIEAEPSELSKVRDDPARAAASELETRRRWLEEELAAVREQLVRRLTSAPTKRTPDSPVEHDRLDWRTTATLGLLLMSADLLAAQQQANPAGHPARLGALREIHLQSKRLLDLLRELERAPAEELSASQPHSESG